MIGLGSTVGNYRVVKKLGSGAMGSVYLAEHPQIGKRVALKVIHPSLADNAEMVSRFFNEARAVNQIGHDNIVEVLDFGQTPDGENFIVMELLEGVNLGDRLKDEEKIPIDEAIHVAIQIADGLASSHDHGIIHRDLKPDNVFLIERVGDTSYVKILDFGLAKLTQGGGALSHRTRAGSVLGTPHYMAPEQCEGRPDIDHRVDVYALGCLLYQMVCGRVPFPGEGFGEVLVKHLHEPPPLPTKFNPDLPKPLERIILNALAKRKEFRFQSMRTMGAALRDPEQYARSLDGEAPITPTIETVAPAALPEELHENLVSDEDGSTLVGTEVPEEVAAAVAQRGNGLHERATMMLDSSHPAIAPIVNVRSAGPGPAVTAMMGAPMRQNTGEALQEFMVPARRRFLPLLIGAGGVLVVVLGIAGFRLLAPHAPTPPAMTTIRVSSTPPGADVVRNGVKLGTTPFDLELTAGSPPTVVKLEKGGYEAVMRKIDPASSTAVEVTLPPLAEPEPAARPAAAAEATTVKSPVAKKTAPPPASAAPKATPRPAAATSANKAAATAPVRATRSQPTGARKKARAPAAGKRRRGGDYDDVLTPSF